jgi:hypothetical protein
MEELCSSIRQRCAGAGCSEWHTEEEFIDFVAHVYHDNMASKVTLMQAVEELPVAPAANRWKACGKQLQTYVAACE